MTMLSDPRGTKEIVESLIVAVSPEDSPPRASKPNLWMIRYLPLGKVNEAFWIFANSADIAGSSNGRWPVVVTYNITPSVHIGLFNGIEARDIGWCARSEPNQDRFASPFFHCSVSFFLENFGRNIVGRPTCYKIGGWVVQCDHNISTFAKSLKDIAYLYCR